jgi:predicted MFS family arabinose efflux permease
MVLGEARGLVPIGLAAFAVAVVYEAFRPANSAAFAEQAPPERLTQAFSVRRLALNLGMTCGPALGGLLAVRDYRLLFLVDGGTCLLAAALLALLDRSPARPPARPVLDGPVASPWRDGPYLALLGISIAYAAVLYQFFSTYPLTLRELHRFGEPQIGSVYAINTVLIVLIEMVLVRRLSGRRPLAVAAWGMLFFCGGFALLPLGHGYLYVAATVVVWTVGEMLTMPFLETVSAARGDERSRGSYLGAYNFAFAVAFAGAPLLGTAVYQRYGPQVVFAACAAVGLVLWLGLRALAPRLSGPAPSTARDRPAAPVPLAAAPPAS